MPTEAVSLLIIDLDSHRAFRTTHEPQSFPRESLRDRADPPFAIGLDLRYLPQDLVPVNNSVSRTQPSSTGSFSEEFGLILDELVELLQLVRGHKIFDKVLRFHFLNLFASRTFSI